MYPAGHLFRDSLYFSKGSDSLAGIFQSSRQRQRLSEHAPVKLKVSLIGDHAHLAPAQECCFALFIETGVIVADLGSLRYRLVMVGVERQGPQGLDFGP